jgi:hypothetical protein
MWLLLLLLQDAPETRAQDPAVEWLESITADRLREHVAFLASDDLGGRLAGFPGSKQAAEYIEKRLAAAGLEPLGDRGESGRSFLQAFHPDRAKELTTHNVVALLKGSDEKLRDECVVIGAHYDHVGRDDQKPMARARRGKATEEDKIWNGADDNASGAAALIEIARAAASRKIRPRRSVLFVFFSAEEWGLLGSKHFVEHPPAEFPVERMAAMVNLDMIGRNDSRPCGIYGLGTEKGELFENAVKGAVELARLDARLLKTASAAGGDSDHSSFRHRKIPIIFFFTGSHADYHAVTDHADKLCYGNMERIGRAAAALIGALADLPERPVFDPEAAKPSVKTPSVRFKLGVMPDYLEPTDEELAKLGLGKDEGVLPIKSVTPGGVGERAGVKAGDMIVSIAGEKLPRQEPIVRYMELLNTRVKPHEPCEIVVLRSGERVVLQAVWGNRLGINVRPVADEERLAKLGLGAEQGAVEVESVGPESAAAAAGLQEGDLILSLGGRILPRKETFEKLQQILDSLPNEPADLEIFRKEERLKLRVAWK